MKNIKEVKEFVKFEDEDIDFILKNKKLVDYIKDEYFVFIEDRVDTEFVELINKRVWTDFENEYNTNMFERCVYSLDYSDEYSLDDLLFDLRFDHKDDILTVSTDWSSVCIDDLVLKNMNSDIYDLFKMNDNVDQLIDIIEDIRDDICYKVDTNFDFMFEQRTITNKDYCLKSTDHWIEIVDDIFDNIFDELGEHSLKEYDFDVVYDLKKTIVNLIKEQLTCEYSLNVITEIMQLVKYRDNFENDDIFSNDNQFVIICIEDLIENGILEIEKSQFNELIETETTE